MMYVKQLLSEIRGMQRMPKTVAAYTDNTAAIDIVRAHGVTARTKHFERWVSYVRDLYQRFIVDVRHRPTDDMPADIFTKALPHESFSRYRDFLLGRK